MVHVAPIIAAQHINRKLPYYVWHHVACLQRHTVMDVMYAHTGCCCPIVAAPMLHCRDVVVNGPAADKTE